MQLCCGDKETEVEVDGVEEATVEVVCWAAAAATRPSAPRTVKNFIVVRKVKSED